MSTFNKLFIGTIMTATLAVVLHSGVRAWRFADSADVLTGANGAAMFSMTTIDSMATNDSIADSRAAAKADSLFAAHKARP